MPWSGVGALHLKDGLSIWHRDTDGKVLATPCIFPQRGEAKKPNKTRDPYRHAAARCRRPQPLHCFIATPIVLSEERLTRRNSITRSTFTQGTGTIVVWMTCLRATWIGHGHTVCVISVRSTPVQPLSFPGWRGPLFWVLFQGRSVFSWSPQGDGGGSLTCACAWETLWDCNYDQRLHE